jgi:AGCS family alanine or glycine:cation symporter
VYKLIFVSFTVMASVTSANNMLNFSDLLVLAMALPNIIGLYMMQDVVQTNLKSYLHKWREGELDREAIRNER